MEPLRLFLCVLAVFISLLSDRLAALASFSQGTDSDFTFSLPAGKKECFFQTMKRGASLEIEYQVINFFYMSKYFGIMHLTDYAINRLNLDFHILYIK
uniref:GOLD domain-containing protein n=1 Tax=Fundulus heteroclitus TaxID=8078 RepID=A0A3Q2Q5E7_FUNHE